MAIGPGAACVPCKTYYVPRKNGVAVMETFEDGRPYKLWIADLLECPDCGDQLVTGYAAGPIAEHYQPGFNDVVKRWQGADPYSIIYIIGCPKSLP